MRLSVINQDDIFFSFNAFANILVFSDIFIFYCDLIIEQFFILKARVYSKDE